MVRTNHDKKIILRELGNGLILRRSTPADVEALSDFDAIIHGQEERGEPDRRVGAWVRDLLEIPHPTFQPSDFTIVEEAATGRIISSMNLISQTWSYGGIPFGVGRPELVGTLPEFRNRGLVRAQFEVIHQWSRERGEKMQAITGIPYYYRTFGYEMAMALGGGKAGFKPHIPGLKEGEQEPYRIRPAGSDDIPFIDQLYRQASQRSLVKCIWNEDLWRYEIMGKSEMNVNRAMVRLIEDLQGQPVGFLAHPPYRWGSMLATILYEIIPGLSWSAVTPSVIRYLCTAGESLPSEPKPEPFESFGFWLGANHPLYRVFKERLPRERKPYAWYLRLPDIPDFLRHIAPVLEQRLTGSPMEGHEGEIKITFYRSGLRLVFKQGRLNLVEAWQPTPLGHSGEAAFPNLTFLQLLFGYRSLDELKYAFADCWTSGDEPAALLEILFPKWDSSVWAVS